MTTQLLTFATLCIQTVWLTQQNQTAQFLDPNHHHQVLMLPQWCCPLDTGCPFPPDIQTLMPQFSTKITQHTPRLERRPGSPASAQRTLAHAFACNNLYTSTSYFLTDSRSGSAQCRNIFIALWKPLAELTVLFQHCCGHSSRLVLNRTRVKDENHETFEWAISQINSWLVKDSQQKHDKTMSFIKSLQPHTTFAVNLQHSTCDEQSDTVTEEKKRNEKRALKKLLIDSNEKQVAFCVLHFLNKWFCFKTGGICGE